MSKEVGVTGGEGRAVFYDGMEPVTCPNPKCGQVLLDLDEDFWDPGPPEVKCRRCGEIAEYVGHLNGETRPGRCIYVFKCEPCGVKFQRKIPGMRRHCPNCNETFYLFWNLLLGLPPRSSKRPRRKAQLEAA